VTKYQKYYQRKKAELIAEAIQFQMDINELELAWWDISDYQSSLEDRARRFGLITEFKENAII
jgi:hypothetical protein